MAMLKMASSGTLVLLVVMAMVLGSVHATCPPQFPLNCASYVLNSREVSLKTCCITLQDTFKLLKPSASLKAYCEAIKGVRLYNGRLAGAELTLALGLPNKCGLSGQYKKGQKCAGKLMSGGS